MLHFLFSAVLKAIVNGELPPRQINPADSAV
jgi:hypothetical protein